VVKLDDADGASPIGRAMGARDGCAALGVSHGATVQNLLEKCPVHRRRLGSAVIGRRQGLSWPAAQDRRFDSKGGRMIGEAGSQDHLTTQHPILIKSKSGLP
jgi:hypothetical protein